jgi:hypothetical protein
MSQKQITAIRTNRIEVDGILKENEWKKASVANDFTQVTPDAGEAATLPTTARVLYDDEAIYIGAHCYGAPDQISKVLSQRDRYNANTDYFSVMIDTYKDRLNGFVFSVSTMGVQYDAKIYGGTYSSKLDMIWYGEVNHSDSGYTVEMKIPYSAIRFSPEEVQNWGINFTRYHTLNREESTWNVVRPDLNNVVAQGGSLDSLENIRPPVRLFFSPYVSGYVDHFPLNNDELSDWSTSLNGGMDIKYGINEAYTLDMTLIPDFGQVVTDNIILNLSPFEVFFQENRPFFNEGVELFEKTGHFYSRRVGFDIVNRNRAFSERDSNEVILFNPNTTQLFNASKVSGRGKKGLGIGVFNAVTAPQFATFEDTITGQQRQIETSPIANYNVVVFDQNLRNNSSVTLTNTNVWRSGETYDANVSAFATQLNTNDNAYFLRGNFSLSQKYQKIENEFGHSGSISTGKQTGNFIFTASYLEQSNTYDQNDLGFLLVNNKRNISKNIAYNIYKPFWKLNRFWSNFSNTYQRLYAPSVYTGTNFSLGSGITTRRFHSASFNVSGTYTENYDYFEARLAPSATSVFIRPQNFSANGWISSNYQKPFALDANIGFTQHQMNGWNDFSYGVSPRFRIGNNYFLVYRFDDVWNNAQRGYAIPFNADNGGQPGSYRPIFANRNVRTTTNTIDFEWNINNKSGINLRVRHYWSRVKINSFYELQETGRLSPLDLTQNEITNQNDESVFDYNFNFFSVDLVYRWIFSPASELTVVWKNNIEFANSDPAKMYFENMQNTLIADQLNSFSIRVVYFLDYLNLKKVFKRKENTSLQ